MSRRRFRRYLRRPVLSDCIAVQIVYFIVKFWTRFQTSAFERGVSLQSGKFGRWQTSSTFRASVNCVIRVVVDVGTSGRNNLRANAIRLNLFDRKRWKIEVGFMIFVLFKISVFCYYFLYEYNKMICDIITRGLQKSREMSNKFNERSFLSTRACENIRDVTTQL